MLDAGFVAAVLEGFQGTLDEVVGRVASQPEGQSLAGCGKRVLDPLKSASAERRINNLQSLVSAGKGFFRILLGEPVNLYSCE